MGHVSVLQKDVLDSFRYLKDLDRPFFVDGTIGAAGHSLMIANELKMHDFYIIGIDQDGLALSLASKKIEEKSLASHFMLVHNNFNFIKNVLAELGIEKIDGALLDLGVSSMQLDRLERGFSFKDPNQKLDMRMDISSKFDARYILNNYKEQEIADILFNFGEEKFARLIAKNVVAKRKNHKIETVGDFLQILHASIKGDAKHQRIHFATRSFQALRIAVNSELDILRDSVFDFMDIMNPGGKLAVITFHSLEDRIIKNTFKEIENPCQCPKALPCICNKKPFGKAITKKPIIPSEKEIALNPRSRSAKLRIIEKI